MDLSHSPHTQNQKTFFEHDSSSQDVKLYLLPLSFLPKMGRHFCWLLEVIESRYSAPRRVILGLYALVGESYKSGIRRRPYFRSNYLHLTHNLDRD
jgi:hypothetical protein